MSQFEERYRKLNPQQKQAVDAIYGPIVVLAGPGSGKTELLSLRIANILQKTDTDPSSILCLTFTENAAKNMRKRLLGLIGNEAHKVAIYTFHGFGSMLMQRFPEFFHGGHNFQPADDVTRIGILQEILQRLPIENPLASYSEAHGFVYERDILGCLSDLRRAGIRPEQFRKIIERMKQFQDDWMEKLIPIFYPRVSKDTRAKISTIIEELRTNPQESIGLFSTPEIQTAWELEQVLNQVEAEDSNTPISKFKASFFDKSQQGEVVIFSEKTLAKWEGLLQIYKEYQEEMFNAGWYDFDDMIMDTLHELSQNSALRAHVFEQYQYVLVDEYQDTSTAQLDLLLKLLPEEQPNILVVGDDDQSIYAFQGANVKNIKAFFTLFPGAETVILEKNYRSQPNIVDLGQDIITHSEDRITNLIPGLTKQLESAHDKPGNIQAIKTKTWDHEKAFIAQEIQAMIDGGMEAGKIAVIAREHKQLIDIARELQIRQVPVHYDYHANVFDMEEVQLLIEIWRCIDALQDLEGKRLYEAEVSFFAFARHAIFGIPLSDLFEAQNEARKQKQASTQKQGSVFQKTVYSKLSPKLREFIESLLGFAQSHTHASFERIHEGLVLTDVKDGWPSYARVVLDPSTAEPSIELIYALRTLIHAIREHYQHNFITLRDALNCIDAYKSAERKLSLKIPGYHATDKVHLLTAHGSKGLEYEHVFIIGANDKTWFSRRNHGKIKLPSIIPDHKKSSDDESVRLFYVSVTRAKRGLTITRHEFDERGAELLPLRVLDFPEQEHEIPVQLHALGPSTTLIPPDEHSILTSALEGFSLTATHLNSFLDILNGGPEAFKWNTLYRFPKPKSYSATYGTLVHAALTEAYRKKLDLSVTTVLFTESLKTSSLDERERERAQHAFDTQIESFWQSIVEKDFAKDQDYLLEYSIKGHIGDIPVKGNLDKIVKSADSFEIIDYKTGSPHTTTKTGTDYQKVKVHKYIRQLQFYLLLVKSDASLARLRPELGKVEFFEQDSKGLHPTITISPDTSELAYVERLIHAMYACIQSHTFPDISHYEQSLAGVLQFEHDLIDGKYST